MRAAGGAVEQTDTKAGAIVLDSASWDGALFAGFYNGSLLLVHKDLVFKFFGTEQSEEEKSLGIVSS
jgi:hypothetical protein